MPDHDGYHQLIAPCLRYLYHAEYMALDLSFRVQFEQRLRTLFSNCPDKRALIVAKCREGIANDNVPMCLVYRVWAECSPECLSAFKETTFSTTDYQERANAPTLAQEVAKMPDDLTNDQLLEMVRNDPHGFRYLRG